MRKPFIVRNEIDRSAKIYLYGIIGDWWSNDPLTAKSFMQALSGLSAEFTRVDVHINSPGGDVWEGLAICNAIRASKLDIHTWNDGICASMAAIILASAKKENRHSAKGSLVMIHNASTIAWGNSRDLKSTAESLDKHDDVLAGFIADATGKTIEEVITDYFDYQDHWLTAKEAEEIGLAVIESYDAEQVPDNVTNMPLMKVAALYGMKEQEPTPTFLEKVANKVKDLLTPQNITDTDMKFPKLEALMKRPAAEVTEEEVNAVKTEMAEAEIEGVSIVLDSELEANATKIVDLTAEVEKEKAEKLALQNRLDAAAVPATAPVAPADKIEGSVVEDSFETSFDREAKARFGN